MKKEKETKVSGGSLADTLKSIKKKFGDGAIMTLHEKPNVNVEALATGSLGLDHALGIGGLPRGRIIELFGAESSGKTTLALHVIAEAQKKGTTCAIVDAEHALDPQYAARLGVNTELLLISQPDGGEEALQIVDALVSSGKVGLVVVDSVAALTPKSEIDGVIGAMQVGAQARLMSQAMRILTASIARTKSTALFINQVRMNISGYGNPETTAGGKALKFYTSVRIDVRKVATIKKGDEAVGSRVRVKVVKNKVAPPLRMTEFDILYNEGISHEGELLALGEKFGIVSRSGASYKYSDLSLGRGYDAARTHLRENTEVRAALLAEIKKHLNETP